MCCWKTVRLCDVLNAALRFINHVVTFLHIFSVDTLFTYDSGYSGTSVTTKEILRHDDDGRPLRKVW